MEKYGADAKGKIAVQKLLNILEFMMEHLNFLTVQEAAELLGVTVFFILKRIRPDFDGPRLPHYRLGHHVRIRESDLISYMETLRNAPAPNSKEAIAAKKRTARTQK